ncbi:MAG: methionine--tRNA ligase [Pseudomonadota bacterium]
MNLPPAPSNFFTTPIYYVNAKPHLGHAYTTIATDVAARFSRMSGKPTYFLTGTDEHGDKIAEAATRENMTPKQYADRISNQFRNLWPRLNISNDSFIRTTDPSHIRVVEQLLSKIHDSGDIYFSEYEGIYCFGCERFYQERELVDGKCPDHLTVPQTIKEANYFFRMSKYQDWLIDHIKTNPDFIRPERYRNEILSFLKEPLEDLCISRPKSRLTWGITLPFDHNYVTYVWFDALTNYISALGYPDGPLFKTFWSNTQHFVAKDIIKPHGIYWPIMLKAAGIPLYRHLNVHGYWNVGGSKMSKSIGNVTDPVEVSEVYGVDAFRYFLMREMVFGLDANFSEDTIVHRINSDLANDLGNLFSRVLSMTDRYFKGSVPGPDTLVQDRMGLSLETQGRKALDEFQRAMVQMEFHKGVIAVWEFISVMNKYIDTQAPWALAKDPANQKALETVMFNLIEGLRVVACLIYPVMPQTSVTMKTILGLAPGTQDRDFDLLDDILPWARMVPGSTIGKPPVLFPRVDTDATRAKAKTQEPQPKKAGFQPPLLKPEITIDDFAKIDLRTGTIVEAHKISKAKKLLKLMVDLGEEKPRQIIAGIANYYAPESIIGRTVIVVANLKPATLMGEVSQGMILAASDDDHLFLTGFDAPITAGRQVK